MPTPKKLEILRQLREIENITQAETAAYFGFKGRNARITISQWESGAEEPAFKHRSTFISYLVYKLGLKDNLERFDQVWQILCTQWNWLPLTESERQKYGLAPLTSRDNIHSISTPEDTDLPSFLIRAVDALDSPNPIERQGAIEILKQSEHSIAYEILARATKHSIRDVRFQVSLVLSQRRDPNSVSGLLEGLLDVNSELRRTAAVALGDLNNKSAVRGLCAALHDPEVEVQLAAIRSLGQIGDETAIPDLGESVLSGNNKIIVPVLKTFAQIGHPSAIPYIAQLSKDNSLKDASSTENYTRGLLIIDTLKRITDKAIIPVLVYAALRFHSVQEVNEAEEAIEGFGDDAIPYVVPYLKDENTSVVIRATEMLGQLKNVIALPNLVETLGHPISFIRFRAAQALGQIGDLGAVPSLIIALSDDDSMVCGYAAQALGKMRAVEAVPRLIDVIGKHMSIPTNERVIESLGSIGDPSAIPHILRFVRESEQRERSFVPNNITRALAAVRTAGIHELLSAMDQVGQSGQLALEAVCEICDPTTVPNMLKTLRNTTDEKKKRCIIKALGKIRDKRAIPILSKLLADCPDKPSYDQSYTLELTIEALGQIGDQAVVPLMINLLDFETFRLKVVNALCNIKDSDSVPALITLLSHKEQESVHRAAVQALRNIGTSDGLAVAEAWDKAHPPSVEADDY